MHHVDVDHQEYSFTRPSRGDRRARDGHGDGLGVRVRSRVAELRRRRVPNRLTPDRRNTTLRASRWGLSSLAVCDTDRDLPAAGFRRPARQASASAQRTLTDWRESRGMPITVTSQETIADIAYATSSGAQKLDLHRPRDSTAVLPLIVDIHGGAFMFGDKTMDASRSPSSSPPATRSRASTTGSRAKRRSPPPSSTSRRPCASCAHMPPVWDNPERIGAFGVRPAVTSPPCSASPRPPTASTTRAGQHRRLERSRRRGRVVRPDRLPHDGRPAPRQPRVRRPLPPARRANSPESRWLGAPIQTIPDRSGRPAAQLPR